jgi:hypothetical protein
MFLSLTNQFHEHLNNVTYRLFVFFLGTILSLVTSKIRTVMFLILILETVFNAEFVGIYMTYPHAKFHMPNSNGSFVIAMKPKTKYKRHAVVILLPYILHTSTHTHTQTRESILTKVTYFLKKL